MGCWAQASEGFRVYGGILSLKFNIQEVVFKVKLATSSPAAPPAAMLTAALQWMGPQDVWSLFWV